MTQEHQTNRSVRSRLGRVLSPRLQIAFTVLTGLTLVLTLLPSATLSYAQAVGTPAASSTAPASPSAAATTSTLASPTAPAGVAPATPTGTPAPAAAPAVSPAASPAAAATATPNAVLAPSTYLPDLPERFFGAVQAITNPSAASQAGVQWERLIFPWALMQPSGPTSWTTGYFTDAQINQEISTGRELVGVALYTPQWASSTPQQPKPTNVPAGLNLPFDDPKNYWGQYMYRLALQYKGKINDWIVWNEPDLYSENPFILYTWEGGINDMYQLVKVASQAVKKANPEARIVFPGTTYWWDKNNGRELYLARYLYVASLDPTARPNGFYFDVADLHTYINPLNDYAAPKIFEQTMAQYGLQKEVWVGESNIPPYDDPSLPIDKTLHGTMDQQASYVIEAFALARAAGVSRMSIYKMVDERPEGGNEEYGLVRNDGSTRPAFTAYQTAVKYMSNPSSAVYTWDGSSDPPTDAQVNALLADNANRTQWIWPAPGNWVTLERGAERDIVAWDGAPQPATVHIPAGAASATMVNKLGQVTGQVTAQNGQYTLTLPPSTDNTDPKDPSEYLVGGDPTILVEQVTPLPTSVDAPIQVVFPVDNPSIDGATKVNVTADMLMPGTTTPVACRWNPTVQLMATVDDSAPFVVGMGTRRLANQDGKTFLVWDFNGVDVSPVPQGHIEDLWISVNGASVNAPHWTLQAGQPQPTSWQQEPGTSCT